MPRSIGRNAGKLAALAVATGIVLTLVIAFIAASGDDNDGASVEARTVTVTETPSATPSANETPIATETPTERPTPSPSPVEDDDDVAVPAEVVGIDRDASASGDKVVYLTFDADTDRGHAEDILEFLKAEGVPASFGITGDWANANPDLVQRVVDDGHVLVNHSYRHRSFTGVFTSGEPLSEQERIAEITQADAIYMEVAGVDGLTFWRPPFGDFDEDAPGQLGALGYRFILMWTIDSLGRSGATQEEIAEQVLGLVEPGAIVLFHVWSTSQDFAALDDIVAALREQGYRFASVNELS